MLEARDQGSQEGVVVVLVEGGAEEGGGGGGLVEEEELEPNQLEEEDVDELVG